MGLTGGLVCCARRGYIVQSFCRANPRVSDGAGGTRERLAKKTEGSPRNRGSAVLGPLDSSHVSLWELQP
jgi:hypothetical protein